MHPRLCQVILLTSLQSDRDVLFRILGCAKALPRRSGLTCAVCETRSNVRCVSGKKPCASYERNAFCFHLIAPRDMPDLQAFDCAEAEPRSISDAWSHS
jgi:hypothetical protein